MRRRRRGLGVAAIAGLSFALASAAPGAPTDPRNLVVMLRWHNPDKGVAQVGAGIIINQDAQGTLIVTARHNLVDASSGKSNTAFTAEFRLRAGKPVAAEPLFTSSAHDVGLLRVGPEDDVTVLGKDASTEALHLASSGAQEVFAVGNGGGVPWSQTLTPVPARFISVAEIEIESAQPLPGYSGGAVFDRDWVLLGMLTQVEAATATALPIGLVLDEIRNRTRYGVALTPSPDVARKAAQRALSSRNVTWSVAGVSDALAAADFEILGQFVAGGAKPGLLAEALATPSSKGPSTALAFFERTKGRAELGDWLRAALGAGLDPNATVPGSYYEQEGLLHAAIRAGNAEAAKALLEGGASPHAYQTLLFTRAAVPRFLFPFNYVVQHESFSREEKRELLAKFVENGGFVPSLAGIDEKRSSFQTIALQELVAKARSIAGTELRPGDRSEVEARKRPCASAQARDDFDWCTLAQEMPRLIRADLGKHLHDFWHLEILGLMTVHDGKAYFLGLEKQTYAGLLAVVEVSRDGRIWRVYRWMRPQAGAGLCRESEPGIRPDSCWRRISMTYEPEQERMMVEDYYPYRALRTP